MLPMILTILKIILFTGLALLALLLVLLIFILAAPIRYQVTGSWKHKLLIQGNVHWLYRILGISWEWRDGSPHMRISLFGRVLGKHTASVPDSASSSASKRSKAAKEPKASKTPKTQKVSKTSQVSPSSPYSNTAKPIKQTISTIAQESQTSPESELVESEPFQKTEAAESKVHSAGSLVTSEVPFQRESGESASSIEHASERDKPIHISQESESIESQRGIDEIRSESAAQTEELESEPSLWTKLHQIFDFLNQESVRKLLRKCWKRLGKFGKHLCPLQVLLQGRIGTDDPALTGKLMEAATVLYAFYGETIALTADFEEEVLEIDFQVKGRVVPGYVLLTVLTIGLRIFRNQECRALWKKLRQNEPSA